MSTENGTMISTELWHPIWATQEQGEASFDVKASKKGTVANTVVAPYTNHKLVVAPFMIFMEYYGMISRFIPV